MEELKEGWRRVKLGEISTFLSGYAFKGSLFSEEGHKVKKIKNVNGKFVDINNTEKYPKELCEKLAKYKIKNNDVLIAMTGAGSVGRVSKFKYKGNNSFYINQRVGKIIIDSEKANSEFIFQIISTQKYEKILFDMANGSGQPNLSPKLISEVEIELPPLETQEKIASILSALDDKIEINNEMNKTLEEMAQTLFKRWFIDFDFPNENGEPYRSSGGKMVDSEFGEIPEGWEVVSFSELIELFNGYSYKGKELMKSNNAMITIKNFNRNGGFQVEGFKEISISDKVRENHYVNKGDVIVAHTDLTQGAEIIGNSIYIQTFGRYEKVITSMDTVKVKSKNHEISNLLIHMFLNHKKFKEHALGYVNGTTVLHLSKKAIPEYKIAIPINKKIFDNMDKLLKPIYIEQNLKLEEVWELTKLRDTLLPKLMSGEVEV